MEPPCVDDPRQAVADEEEEENDHDLKEVKGVSRSAEPVLIDHFVELSNAVAAHVWFCNVQPVHWDG